MQASSGNKLDSVVQCSWISSIQRLGNTCCSLRSCPPVIRASLGTPCLKDISVNLCNLHATASSSTHEAAPSAPDADATAALQQLKLCAQPCLSGLLRRQVTEQGLVEHGETSVEGIQGCAFLCLSLWQAFLVCPKPLADATLPSSHAGCLAEDEK